MKRWLTIVNNDKLVRIDAETIELLKKIDSVPKNAIGILLKERNNVNISKQYVDYDKIRSIIEDVICDLKEGRL